MANTRSANGLVVLIYCRTKQKKNKNWFSIVWCFSWWKGITKEFDFVVLQTTVHPRMLSTLCVLALVIWQISLLYLPSHISGCVFCQTNVYLSVSTFPIVSLRFRFHRRRMNWESFKNNVQSNAFKTSSNTCCRLYFDFECYHYCAVSLWLLRNLCVFTTHSTVVI